VAGAYEQISGFLAPAIRTCTPTWPGVLAPGGLRISEPLARDPGHRHAGGDDSRVPPEKALEGPAGTRAMSRQPGQRAEQPPTRVPITPAQRSRAHEGFILKSPGIIMRR
jgi:hypothetical protein